MNHPGRAGLVRSPGILVLAVALAGCASAPPASPAGVASAAPSIATVTPSNATTATVAPSPTPQLTPVTPPSPTLAPAAGFTTPVPPTADAGWTSLQFAELPPDSPLAGVTSVVRIPGGFLALGAAVRDATAGTVTTPVWHSPDGATWTALDPATFGPSTVVLRLGATASGPVAVTVGATIGDCQPSDDPSCYSAVAPVQSWTSTDGTTWTAHDVSGVDLQPCDGCNVSPPRVAIGPGGVLAYQPVALGTQLALSTDGATWQPLPVATIPAKAAIGDLEAFGDGFVAVGADPDGKTAVALVSSDGRTWTEHMLPVSDLGSLGAGGDRALVARNGILAEGSVQATPGQGLWWTTGDGSSWKPDAHYAPLGVWNGEGEGSGLFEDGSTAADGERIVALRRDGGLAGWTSTNGSEWFKLEVTGLEPTPKGSWPDLDITQLPIGVLYRADDGTTWFGTPSDR